MLEWVLLQKQEDPPGTLTNVPGATLLAVSPGGQAWLRYDDPTTRIRYSWRGRTADPLALDYVASFETLEEGAPDGPPASTGHLSIVRSGQTLVIGRDVRGPKVPGRGSIHPLIPVLSGGMLLPDVAQSLARHVECDAEEALAPPEFDKESLAPFDQLEITHELSPHERVTLRINAEGVFVVFVDEFPGFGSRERLEPIAGPEAKHVLDNLLFATAAPLFLPPPQKIMPPDGSPMSIVITRGHRRADLLIDKFRARDMPRWTHLVRALEDLTESPSQRVFVG